MATNDVLTVPQPAPPWNIEYTVIPPLNYCDWNALWAHRRWLPSGTSSRLNSINYRIESWPQRFDRPKHLYRQNACLIAMSEFENKSEFCRCGTIGSRKGKFHYGRCGLWKICPYCSHRKRWEIWKKYLPAFRRGRWWFLTISPEEMCNLNICTVDCVVKWWEGCRYALHTLINEGYVQGAFILETISVHHYWPHARALPHVHVVLLAYEMARSTTDYLKHLMSVYSGQFWNSREKCWVQEDRPERLWSRASTCTSEVRRDYDFASVLSYMCNPVNLAAAYLQDWPKVRVNTSTSVRLAPPDRKPLPNRPNVPRGFCMAVHSPVSTRKWNVYTGYKEAAHYEVDDYDGPNPVNR